MSAARHREGVEMPKPAMRTPSKESIESAIQQVSSRDALKSKNGAAFSDSSVELIEIEVSLGDAWFSPPYSGDFSDTSASKTMACWTGDAIELHVACKSASGATTIMTLPEPARPAKNIYFLVSVGGTAMVCTIATTGDVSVSSGSAGSDILGSVVFTPVYNKNRSRKPGLPVKLSPKKVKNPHTVLASSGCSGLAWDALDGVRIVDIYGVPAGKKAKISVLLIGA